MEQEIHDKSFDVEPIVYAILSLTKFIDIFSRGLEFNKTQISPNEVEKLKKLIDTTEEKLKHLSSSNLSLQQPLTELLTNLKNLVIQITREKEERQPVPKEAIDKWGIIESTKRLIDNYSSTEDILIPLLWFEVINNLHTLPIPDVAIRVPSTAIRSLINKLLREAPYSYLLQNIKEKEKPELIEEEKQAISKVVNTYKTKFTGGSTAMEAPELVLEEAKMFLEAFNWGRSNVEKRILQLLYNKMDEYIKKAREEKNSKLSKVYAATAILFSRLSNVMIELPRIRKRLEEMKP